MATSETAAHRSALATGGRMPLTLMLVVGTRSAGSVVSREDPDIFMRAAAPGGARTESLRGDVERVSREARGHDYGWEHVDDGTTRTQLSLVGSGGVHEVLSGGGTASTRDSCSGMTTWAT
ncbi:hypothetical protein [Myxococcus sp. CA039A]|uniref:hypothetical protein n=1 Tax=Myxococcus sp. CA039A TaxID=2741737 RepID=UPI00157B7A48|nr:hypothetical protein [Myxococcus sp. CA039A]NTX53801.1 hypothetical protein [Myxococcus sp. CA039A]